MVKWNEMRIRKRLVSAFSVIVAIFSVVSVIVVITLVTMVLQYTKVLDYYAFPQGNIGRLMNASAEVRSNTRAIIGYSDTNQIASLTSKHENRVNEFERYLEIVRPTMISAEGKQCISKIDKAWKAYIAKDNELLELASTGTEEARIEAQGRMTTEAEPLYTALDEALVELMDLNVEKGDSTEAALTSLAIIMVVALILVVIVAIIICLRIANYIARGIEDPLKNLGERLSTFSRGDLDSPFPVTDSQDEISDMIDEAHDMATTLQHIIGDMNQLLDGMARGDFTVTTNKGEHYVGQFEHLLNGMRSTIETMSGTLTGINEAVQQVNAGSDNLSQASQTLAEGATDQAASVEQMQATVITITEGINSTATKLKDAYDNANRYSELAEGSRDNMAALMESMVRISEASQQIAHVISEIEDIANQTNLLSLNASIEAARAGEVGRGFAVVADQIRALAEQSAKSVIDSRTLLEDALREVAEGNSVAQRTSDSLQEVINGVGEIAETSKELSTVAADQALAMEQANEGISRISEIVQSNAATAEETSATSEELAAEAACMNELVARFKL